MTTPILQGALTFPAVAVITLLVLVAWAFGAFLRRDLPRTVSVAAPVIVAIATSATMTFFRLTNDVYLLSDEKTWHAQSISVAEYLSSGQSATVNLSAGKEGYSWIIGTLYWISGPAPLVPIVFGALTFILLVPICGAVTNLVARDLRLSDVAATKAVRWACYFVALCPAIVIWVPRMLRESISMLLIGLMILWFLKYLEARRPMLLIGVGLMAAVMVTIRAQVGMGIIAGIVLSSIVAYSTRYRHVFSRVMLVGPCFALIFAVTWAFVDSTSDLSAESIALRNRALTDASSAFDGGETAYTADSLLEIVLFNLPRAALGPFPTELNLSGGIVIAAMSNIFWLACILGALLLFPGLRRAEATRSQPTEKRRARSFVVLVVLAMTLVAILSITAGNYGLVVRMRLMPLVALIPAAAIGFQVWRHRRSGDVLFRQEAAAVPLRRV